jgi:HD-like signal output (HDOD) protein/GGDEF domain-containing protein
MSNPSATLDSLVESVGQLYSLPAVAVEVLELTSDPTADAPRLKECIEKDPALTTRILRVVNSSLFGLSQGVSDLNQALALLGMKPLKLLVLGFSLPEALFEGLEEEVLSRYWQRTLVKAIAAREICLRRRPKLGDEAFIGGLVQDIGLLVLLRQVGEPMARFVVNVRRDGGNLYQLERLAFGFDQRDVSARLLAAWRLPESLIEAIKPHDSGEAPGGAASTVAEALNLAELVSCLLCDGQTVLFPMIVEEHNPSRSFTPSWLDELIEDLQQKVPQLADSLRVELPSGLDYRGVLDRARQQMIKVAEDLVGDLVARAAPASLTGAPDCDAERRLLTEASALEAAFASTCRQSRPAVARKQAAVAAAPDNGERCGAAWSIPATDSSIVEDDRAMLDRLQAEAMICRQRRTSLTLLLVELDRYEDLVAREGQNAAQALMNRLCHQCAGLDHEGIACLQIREARFAVILPDCDRCQGARLGNELIGWVRSFKRGRRDDGRPAVSISIGAATVALPSRGFQARELMHSADRCLYVARASGGDVLKSIEVY